MPCVVLATARDWDKYCENNPRSLFGDHWRERLALSGGTAVVPVREWHEMQNHGGLPRSAVLTGASADWAHYCALNPIVRFLPDLRPRFSDQYPPLPLPERPPRSNAWRVIIDGPRGYGARELARSLRSDVARRFGTGPRGEKIVSHQTATGHHTVEVTPVGGPARRFHYDYAAESLFEDHRSVLCPGGRIATEATRKAARLALGRDFLDDRVLAIQRLTALISSVRVWVFVLCENPRESYRRAPPEETLSLADHSARCVDMEAFYVRPGQPFRTTFVETADVADVKESILAEVCANRN